MERKALIVCCVVGFLGLLSAATSFAAEATRIKVSVYFLFFCSFLAFLENPTTKGSIFCFIYHWMSIGSSTCGLHSWGYGFMSYDDYMQNLQFFFLILSVYDILHFLSHLIENESSLFSFRWFHCSFWTFCFTYRVWKKDMKLDSW